MLSSAWFLDTLRCVFMLKINGLVRNLIFFWNLNQFFLINFNNLNRLDNKNCISCFSFHMHCTQFYGYCGKKLLSFYCSYSESTTYFVLGSMFSAFSKKEGLKHSAGILSLICSCNSGNLDQ
jgi:hypothetical protein